MMESLSSLLLARLQYLQDMLARSHEMSICLCKSDGTDFSIPSNQQECCGNSEPCGKFIRSAINRAREERDRIFLTCHQGLTTAISPLGLSLPKQLVSVPQYYLLIGRLALEKEADKPEGLSEAAFEHQVEIITIIFDLIFSLALIGGLDFVDPGCEAAASPLTEREKEIIRLVSQGLSNQGIADQLFISDKTVKTHLSNIFKKLEMRNRTELARYAFQTLV